MAIEMGFVTFAQLIKPKEAPIETLLLPRFPFESAENKGVAIIEMNIIEMITLMGFFFIKTFKIKVKLIN